MDVTERGGEHVRGQGGVRGGLGGGGGVSSSF